MKRSLQGNFLLLCTLVVERPTIIIKTTLTSETVEASLTVTVKKNLLYMFLYP